MGMFRKLMSVSTGGTIDYRSDKERIARSTRRTSKSAKQQAEAMQALLALQQEQANKK